MIKIKFNHDIPYIHKSLGLSDNQTVDLLRRIVEILQAKDSNEIIKGTELVEIGISAAKNDAELIYAVFTIGKFIQYNNMNKGSFWDFFNYTPKNN